MNDNPGNVGITPKSGDPIAHLNGPQPHAIDIVTLNNYSMALCLEEHQPSGTRSIPRFDNATLRQLPSTTCCSKKFG